MHILLILIMAFSQPTYKVDMQITNARRCKMKLELRQDGRFWKNIYISPGQTVFVYGRIKTPYIHVTGKVDSKDYCGCDNRKPLKCQSVDCGCDAPCKIEYQKDGNFSVYLASERVSKFIIGKPSCKIP